MKKTPYETMVNNFKNGNIIVLSKEYKNANTPLHLKCKICSNEWKANYHNFKINGCRCPKCSYVKQSHKHDDVKKHYKNKKIILLSDYVNAHIKNKLQCMVCNFIWFSNYNKFKSRNHGCPNCKAVSGSSKSEEIVRKIFEKITGFSFPKVRNNLLINPKTNKRMELDGYNKELKLAFEYNGEQHYKPVKFFNKRPSDILEKRIKKDEIKKELCYIMVYI